MFTRLKEVSAKKLIIISISLLIITCLIVFGPKFYQSYRDRKEHLAFEKEWEKTKQERLELETKVGKLKEWPVRESYLHLGAKEVKLETKWAGGKMLYKFDVSLVDGPTQILQNRNSSAGFILDFLDTDGFKVFTFNVSLKSMTAFVDEKGKTIGLSINDKKEVSAEEYLTFDSWSSGWDF